MPSKPHQTFADAIPVDRLSGLRPSAWLCVGSGFLREDIKAELLSKKIGFVAEAVTGLQELCRRLLSISADRVLSAPARQEVLRLLLAEPRIGSKMNELKRLRRQRTFFRRLDLSIQAARNSFSHWEEERVLSERLEQRVGANPVRDEVRALAMAYEAWLQGQGLLDPALLVRAATELLRAGWPARLSKPGELYLFSAQASESLEAAFWDAFGLYVPVRRVEPSRDERASEKWSWERWHTLDDAAEDLAEAVAADPEKNVVLIPDIPEVRRSLMRALKTRNVPLADPRDPTRLRWEEAIKRAILPLELVARDFERAQVISWLRQEHRRFPDDDFMRLTSEIQNRGIRRGLSQYSGGNLVGLHSRLKSISDLLGGKRTCEELGEAHLRSIREQMTSETLWVSEFFESFWKAFIEDTERIGCRERRALPLYWLERLEARLAEASPPVERLKSEGGLRIFRLQQAPLAAVDGVTWIFGLPSSWLSAESAGDYWFTEREREVLSSEFGVRSGIQIREERLSILRAWVDHAPEWKVLDAHYSSDGRERESVFSVLKEIFGELPADTEPVEKGSHPRWVESYGALRPIPPQTVQLSALPRVNGDEPPELTATALDRMSRCAFQALTHQRWNLWDQREADADLWPEVRGNILHEAVRILLSSRDGAGNFRATLGEALDQAWTRKPPRGLIRNPRIEKYVKSRLLLVLEAFCEKEKEFIARARTRTLSLEEMRFRLRYPDFAIVGEPDRIEENPDGIFISDYKTSSGLPNGTEMVELGYRLQLPFYALAAKKNLGKPVLGVQFIELTRKAGRGSGVFFRHYNGKETGKLTNARSNSKSLFAAEPDEIWSRLEDQIIRHATRYVQGAFEARPKKREKECRTCMASDLCGMRRLGESDDGA